jgi:hypothetical protein
MTQQIKFRGFRTDGKGWVEGYLMQNYVHHKGLTIVQGGCIYNEIHPDSLGMFTGQPDKNGKEIYGAIGEKGGDVDQYGCVVYWYNGGFILGKPGNPSFILMQEANNIEIIGNQFENNGK